MIIEWLNKDDVVPRTVRLNRNQRKTWKYGYDEEFDMIIISKDGTVGEICVISDLKIALPNKPPKSEILFHDKPKEKQFWKREKNPPITDKNISEYDWWIEREFRRRDEGVFFYNNGTPTYLTGDHYFMLQHCKIPSETGTGYGWYTEPLAVLAYFWEACKADHRCYGMLYLKNRRIFFSTFSMACLLNGATRTYDSLFGIISKTNKDASSVFEKAKNAFRFLPIPFKPMIDTISKSEMAFSEQVGRITKNKQSVGINEGLNTILDYRATALNSYDSEKVKMILCDEVSKYPKDVPAREYWDKVKPTLRLGRTISGRALVGSTMNPLNKGGDQFVLLWNDSDHTKKRNENGQTVSGLYRIAILADDNYEGFFDLYGRMVKEDVEGEIIGIDGKKLSTYQKDGKTYTQGVKSYLDAEQKSQTGANLLRWQKENPRTIQDALRDEVEGNNFNQIKIYQQIDYNEGMTKEPVRYYELMWKDGIRDTEVVAVPRDINTGKFVISWLPPAELRNKHFVKNGRIYPANGHIGGGGCDTYDHKATVDSRGSNGSLHLKTKFSMSDSIPSNAFVLEYIARPSSATEFYEDVLMACYFFGFPILYENNKPGIEQYFDSRGYQEYLIWRPKSLMAKNERYRTVRKGNRGVPSTSEHVIQAHAEAIQYYIETNVGYNEETGEYGNMPFNRTLHDWKNFDITNRTKFDASISSGYAIIATQGSYSDNKSEEEEKPLLTSDGSYRGGGKAMF